MDTGQCRCSQKTQCITVDKRDFWILYHFVPSDSCDDDYDTDDDDNDDIDDTDDDDIYIMMKCV